MAERAGHDRRRSRSFSKPHARLRTPEERHVCSGRRRSRADRRLARGPGDLRERHGDLVTRRIPAAAPRVAESSTRHIRQSHSGDDLLGRAASRASGRVAPRRGHRGESEFCGESQQEDRARARARARARRRGRGEGRARCCSGTRRTRGCCGTTSSSAAGKRCRPARRT